MFKVMALDLWRDRAALVMAFLLPPLVFLIFSAVFSGTSGADVKLQVAVADLAHTRASARLTAALLADKDLRAERRQPRHPGRRAGQGALRPGRRRPGDPRRPGRAPARRS